MSENLKSTRNLKSYFEGIQFAMYTMGLGAHAFKKLGKLCTIVLKF